MKATRGIAQVYNLAADMGGIGYITSFHARIARNNVLINAHMLEASRRNGVRRFLFSSSACVYAQFKQQSAEVTPLREEDAYPVATGLATHKLRVAFGAVAEHVFGRGPLLK